MGDGVSPNIFAVRTGSQGRIGCKMARNCFKTMLQTGVGVSGKEKEIEERPDDVWNLAL